ncbi:hypothetical protein GGI35DRAFT_464030 [Trichoderma velutinum]
MIPMLPGLLQERWRARTAILDLHIRRWLLAVHQAFIVYPKDQKLFHYSRTACLDSASVFLSAQHTLVHEELASSLLLSTQLHAFILTCFLLMQHAWPESFASQGSLSYMCSVPMLREDISWNTPNTVSSNEYLLVSPIINYLVGSF